MTDPTHPPEGEPLIRAIAMPADANPSGDIFGGWLMSQWISPPQMLPAVVRGGVVRRLP
jgi:acyl-CoA thioesterase YciA